MSEINLLREYCRMCKSSRSCSYCPFEDVIGKRSCITWMYHNLDKATKIITKWAQEHPQKTRQDVFMERYPNASVENGVLNICPTLIEGNENTKCSVMVVDGIHPCINCTREYWLAPAEEEE